MKSMTSREQVCDDLLTLPEDAFLAVREFVLFQKSRSAPPSPSPRPSRAVAPVRKSAALSGLLKFKGSLARDVDCAAELGEALDEKHKRSL